MSDLEFLTAGIEQARRDSYEAGVRAAVDASREATPEVVQRDDAWLQRATPEEVYDAHRYGELATLEGTPVDDSGWPLGQNGKRISLTRRPS